MALIRVYNKDTGNFDIYYNSNDIPNLENYYTKNEIDIMLENLEVDVDLSNYYTKLQIDNLLNNKLNLSDVYDWAKQPNKPSYTYGEVGAAPANHTHPEYYTEAMLNTKFAGLGYDSALQKLRYDTGMRFYNVASEKWVEDNFSKPGHNHIISNVDGLQTALNGKLGTGETAYNSTRWNGYRIRVGSYSSGTSGYITFGI